MLLKARLVPANQTVIDHVDVFQNDGFTRISGLAPLQAQVFFNGTPQPWTTVSGANVGDAQVVAGYVYWNEIGPGLGLYNIRWRPNAMGFWRLVFTYNVVPQIVTLDYDVAATTPAEQGLTVSFIG